MPERLTPERPKASAVFHPEPPTGGEHASPPPGRGAGGGSHAEAGSLLAFDFGEKRIGVAIGTQLGAGQPGPARALTTIAGESNDARFAAIAALIAEWQPIRLVVGRPLSDDGTPHEMTARCERFANQLRGRFRLPVDVVDERYSSTEADANLRQRGLFWPERKTRVDAEAALIVLRSWFDTHAIA
jgi:putative holliday junction resolvase